jgi:hypothetical protein
MEGGLTKLVRGRPLATLWIAMIVMILGRLLDLQWHATHDEFEGTAQQFEAHWLLWSGVLMVLAVAAIGVRTGVGGTGYRLVLLSTILYVPLSTWHFIEHANGADPELAHVLLGITNFGMVAGAIVALIETRRTSPAT